MALKHQQESSRVNNRRMVREKRTQDYRLAASKRNNDFLSWTRVDYDKDAMWEIGKLALRNFQKNPPVEMSDAETERFIRLFTPLIGETIRKRYREHSESDRDDMVSLIVLTTLHRMRSGPDRFLVPPNANEFTGYLRTTINNIVLDWIRARHNRRVGDYVLDPERDRPHSTRLELRLDQEWLYERVISQVHQWNRTAGRDIPHADFVVRIAVKADMESRTPPVDLLVSWFGVDPAMAKTVCMVAKVASRHLQAQIENEE